MEKNTRDELIKVGAYIESKNGVDSGLLKYSKKQI